MSKFLHFVFDKSENPIILEIGKKNLVVDNLLAGNLAQVLAVVQHGVQTDENQEIKV